MRSREKISPHVSYTEATKSITAIEKGVANTPNEQELANMRAISQRIFEMVRSKFKVPIAVTSFFRSVKLNKYIPGASSTSQHCKGEAMDLDADVYGMVTNREIFDYIKDCLEFDQLIWEHGDKNEPAWVHVSLKRLGNNRKQVLKAYKAKHWTGKLITKYEHYKG